MRLHKGTCFLILFMALILICSGCSTVPSTKPYLAKDRNSRWVNDINYLEKALPKLHKNLYFHMPEAKFMGQLDDLKRNVSRYTDEYIQIKLSVILAGIGDTHTGSNIGSETMYPVEMHWFDEGIYITNTAKGYENLCDAQIVTLNGRKIEEAANKLRPLFEGANESWFKTQVVYYLQIPGVIRYFGLSSTDEIDMGLKLKNGDIKSVKLKPISYKDYVEADKRKKIVPLYLSHLDKNYWYEYLRDNRILYVNYSSCSQMRDKPFEIFDKELWRSVKENKVDRLVLDIRENRGGKSDILDPFIKKLKKSEFNQQGRLYVIIGKDTYSSAILNAVSLRKDTKAYFVGEDTGGEPNHYGDVIKFKLPNSQLTIRCSTKYFHDMDGTGNTLKPDKVIKETFKDYQNGTDPVMEWITKQGTVNN